MESKKILVIEDNELNMKLVKSLLRLQNLTVLEAGDAEKGIQLAREALPDLILMDIQLPGMDGLAATRIIKDDPALRKIPIIALTSHAMQGDEERALSAGCNDYMSKPIDTRLFPETIQRHLRGDQDDPERRGHEAVHRIKVLIVDDDPLNVKLLERILACDAYVTQKAFSGEEALEKVSESAPDVVLLDIMMPGLNGYEVTERLKSNEDTKAIPIILITALDGPESRIRGMETGADDFINKPVNREELLARVASMARLKQYREQLESRNESRDSLLGDPHAREASTDKKEGPVVLIVEDQETDVKLLRSYLEGEGYRILGCKSGEEAIQTVSDEKVDLVLLDILLPGADGFQVCQQLKGAERTRNTQIVMITSLTDLESKVAGIEIGTDDYLIKPIYERELRARVKALIRKKRYLDELQSHHEKTLNRAITDSLTGLYNHTYFKHFLTLEVKRALRYGYPVGFSMVDIDDFKAINDACGHLAGDRILRELSDLMRKNIREIDFIARYGSEKFAIVQPYTDKRQTGHIAERLLEAVRKHEFNVADRLGDLKVRISAGVSVCPVDATTDLDLIQRAETMLYQAKRNGKNQVVVSG